MKLQIVSDIHGEYYDNFSWIWRRLTPKAKVVIVAGDIHSKYFEEQLNEIGTKFDLVLAIYGNHDWYGKDISWRANTKQLRSNVKVLDDSYFVYDDIVFIGSTLWTDFRNSEFFTMNSAKLNINDFKHIKNSGNKFSPEAAYKQHLYSKSFIKESIKKFNNKKVVVITHFVPSYALIHPKWRQGNFTDLNYYFSAYCDDLFDFYNVKLWVYGHTHDSNDCRYGNIRFVANPLGYPNQNHFNDKVVII